VPGISREKCEKTLPCGGNLAQSLKATEIMSRTQESLPACPVCHSEGTLFRAYGPHRLYACPGCRCLFYFPFSRDDTPSAYEPLESCPFQVERGANLLFSAQCIHQVNAALPAGVVTNSNRTLDVLEVGCSYGFLMDMARRLHGWNVAGVDPDPCAAQGGMELELNITQANLEELEGEALYDVIVSVETIEHVRDPREHVLAMGRLLRDGGVIFLTTPDASRSDLGPHLWPGEHHVIFSRSGLEILLDEAGLRWRYFFTTSIPEIMGVLACRQPLRGDGILDVDSPSNEVAGRVTVGYLISRIREIRAPVVLMRGLHARLFELLVNQGRYSEAEPVGRALDELLGLSEGKASYPLLDQVVNRMCAASDSMEYVCAGPACMAPYLYYKGMLALNHWADYTAAAKYFGGAARLFRKEVEAFDLTHFRPFLAAAEAHEKLATLRKGGPLRRVFRRVFS